MKLLPAGQHLTSLDFPGLRQVPGHGSRLGPTATKARWTGFGYQPYCETRPEWDRPRLTVTRWAPHDLQRTARTLLASPRCPDEVDEAILGHMKPGIVGVYNLHTYDAERVGCLRQLDAHLEALVAVR